jgi:hypothetical protein
VWLGAAERQQAQPVGPAVGELAAHAGRHARQRAGLERVLLTLHEERQRPLEDEVDLLLALVAVDAPPLTGLQDDLVEPERAHAELLAQPHEALAGVVVQRREGDPGLHGAAA